MLTPEKVRDIMVGMKQVVSIPLTVKCRIGVDGMLVYLINHESD